MPVAAISFHTPCDEPTTAVYSALTAFDISGRASATNDAGSDDKLAIHKMRAAQDADSASSAGQGRGEIGGGAEGDMPGAMQNSWFRTASPVLDFSRPLAANAVLRSPKKHR